MDNMPMYKALLKWSLTQTDGTTGPSTAMPMNDERRKFLAAAMESCVLDETKRMHDILTILKYERHSSIVSTCCSSAAAAAVGEKTVVHKVALAEPTPVGAHVETKPPALPSPSPTALASSTLSYYQIVSGAVAARLTEKKKDTTFIVDTLGKTAAAKLVEIKTDALRELSERVEQIDNATYFACGAGGSGELPLLFGLLKSGATPLQVGACNVLKTILQNNPKSQEKALKFGGMNVLLLTTQTHPEMKMRVKAFSCLSALLRYRDAVPVLAFANAGGLDKCVMPALTNNSAPPLQKKVLFFLQYVVSADDSFAASRFTASGIVRALGGLLASKDDDIVEQSATILHLLLQNRSGLEANMKCLLDPALKVKTSLKTQLSAISAKPEEEREYYEEMEGLLKKLSVTLR